MTSADRIPLVVEHMLAGYHKVTPLDPGELELLFDLIEARLVVTMLVAAYRRTQMPDEPNYLANSRFGCIDVIDALRRLTRAGFDSIVREGCSPTSHPAPRSTVEDLVSRRKRVLGSRPYLFYDRPLHLVRGESVWLMEDTGRRFLDCYNNVPIVGHCHPHVVAAISRQ